MNDERKLPARFGNYFLFDHIGQGGMAEIFLAKTHTELGTERLCVIKRILPALNSDRDFCEMLIKEANLCAHLSHTNVVQTYELGQIDNQYYISMEYVEGVDLNRLLGLLSRARIALPLQFALFIIIETLRGLDYAHRLCRADGPLLGIIHRDVSPTNVLISTEGEVKICDFGIAKVQQDELEASVQHVDEHHLKGKVAYMAPEHLNGGTIDLRADLFAAGILFWELLNGRRLYKTKDDEETFRRAKEADIPPLQDRDYPEYDMLAAIIRKALSPDPNQRFANGQEFIRAIEDYMHMSGLIVSQLKFSDFLMENFGDALRQQRLEREQNLASLISFAPPEEKTPQPLNRFTMSLLSDEEDEDDEPAHSPSAPFEPPDVATQLAAKFDSEPLTDTAIPSPVQIPKSTRSIVLPLVGAVAAIAIAAFLTARFLGYL